MTELEALKAIDESLSRLDEEARTRVLRWAADKYKMTGASVRTDAEVTRTPAGSTAAASDLPTYFNEAQPGSGAEKALVVGAWFQEVQGFTDFESSMVNRELKHLGYPSSNITRDFDDLMNRRPKLVVQTRKSGSTKQARKLYRLTHEGLSEVAKLRGHR